MAPEVSMKKFHKVGSYNLKADCWSLGVILYQMLSGRFPFPGGSDQEQRILSGRYRPMIGYRWDRVKKEAKDLVSSLLEVDLERRLSSDKILQHPWISRDELEARRQGRQEYHVLRQKLRRLELSYKLQRRKLKIVYF